MALGARWLVIAVFTVGCAHEKPGVWNAAQGRLCQGKRCYRVGKLDGEWQLVKAEGGEVGFFNRGVGGIIQANSTCRSDADAAGLDTLTRHLLIGYTDRKVIETKELELAKRQALHTKVKVRLDGVPFVLDLYVLKRNGCIFDLSYAAPPATAAQGEKAFRGFVEGFADERGS
jgi:hypothetical protein